MSGAVVLLVLIILLVAGFFVWQNLRQSRIGERADLLIRSERNARREGGGAAPTPELSLETLRPGDAVAFWDGENAVVDCILQCEEQLAGRTTRWRWNLLRGGRMLETAPDDNVLYAPGQVVYQGDELFDKLTAKPAAGGVLQTFEARVQAQTVGANPVYFTFQDQEFRLRSTGTFRAVPLGTVSAEVFRDVSEDPSQNTYFEMESADGKHGLGIWTTHILLLVGDKLGQSDISGLYPGQPTPSTP